MPPGGLPSGPRGPQQPEDRRGDLPGVAPPNAVTPRRGRCVGTRGKAVYAGNAPASEKRPRMTVKSCWPVRGFQDPVAGRSCGPVLRLRLLLLPAHQPPQSWPSSRQRRARIEAEPADPGSASLVRHSCHEPRRSSHEPLQGRGKFDYEDVVGSRIPREAVMESCSPVSLLGKEWQHRPNLS